MSETDSVFAGSVPKLYETLLVPLIFEPYATDLKNRVASMHASRILEIAAGTGVVTRALATIANDGMSIVATDLNQAMLNQAAAVGTVRPVKWQQADAMARCAEPGELCRCASDRVLPRYASPERDRSARCLAAQ